MTELSAELREMAERAGLITWAITDDIRGGHEANLAAFARLVAEDCAKVCLQQPSTPDAPVECADAILAKYAPRD